MSSFHETGEFGGRKQSDVAGSPPADDRRFLLIHYLIENARQIINGGSYTWFHPA